MLTLTQATDLLADAYEVEKAPLQSVRKRMVSAGMLPTAIGRDIPQANPARMTLLVIGLGIGDVDRINELADARVFERMPGDSASTVTLQQTLGFMIDGLINDPGYGIDASLSLTTSGPPVAFIQRKGKMWMQFSGGQLAKGFINGTVHIALQPLTAFCAAALATQPPYKVAK